MHLGLSIATVSRALNGKPDVNPHTRERVLETAVKLGYSANASGRSLRRGVTQTVAFIMETGLSDVRGGDNFFMRVVDAMQDHLATEGWDLVILPSSSSSDPVQFLKRMIGRGVADAYIVTATRASDPRITLLLESGTPFLSFGRSQVPGSYAWIDLDFEGFLREAMHNLHRLGHRRIAISTPKGESNIGPLLREAYKSICAELELPHDTELTIDAEHSEIGGRDIVRSILDRPGHATAVILNYELMALGAYSALHQAGLSPGVDLSIITLRRSQQLRFLDPPVSACDIDLSELGKRLAAESLRVVRSETPNVAMLWPTELRLTNSVGSGNTR